MNRTYQIDSRILDVEKRTTTKMQERNMWKPETDSKTLSAGLSPMEGREKKAWHGK